MNSYNECKAIVELDLDPIKVKLMHKQSGEGWTLEQACAVESEYRRFLYMMKAFPDDMLAPSEDVDTFWHYHILDTVKYARDCDEVFGYFLHHFPYLGMRGEDDLVALGQAGDRMAELYEASFGEKYRWDLIAETAAAQSTIAPLSGEPAFCMTTKSAAAFCMTTKPAAAFCMTTKSAAFCMTTKPATNSAAFCMTTKPATKSAAFCMTTKPAAAFCMTTKAAAAAFCMTTKSASGKRDETNSPAMVADDALSTNKFPQARPKLPMQAQAN